MTVPRSMVLFPLVALAEIGGAWLIWQGVREHHGPGLVGAALCLLGVAVIMYAPRANQRVPLSPWSLRIKVTSVCGVVMVRCWYLPARTVCRVRRRAR
jgi:Uncharacterised BCR, YnfA/UPF0060 family